MNFCLKRKFYKGAKRLSLCRLLRKNSKNSFCNHRGHVAVTSFTHSPGRPVRKKEESNMWTYSGNVGGYYGGYTSEPPVIHRDYRFETPMDLGNYASLTSTIPWQTWSTVDLPNMTSDKEEGPEVKIHDVNNKLQRKRICFNSRPIRLR